MYSICYSKTINYFIFVLLIWAHAYTQEKSATQVFGKWLDWQKVFNNPKISSAHASYDDSYWENFKNIYDQKAAKIIDFKPFLSTLTNGRIDNIIPENGRNNMVDVYKWCDYNPGALLQYMQGNNFISKDANEEEQKAHINDTIKKYRRLLDVLSNHHNSNKKSEYLFAFANRMFEWCFGAKTFSNFYTLMNKKDLHQLTRFCYTTMWYNLVSEGWLNWNVDCLKSVKRDAQAGKEIVYVAGGNDIYQLLKNQIYNIRVIDPMLPSQPDYYAEGWDWLIQGEPNNGLGDYMNLKFDNKTIVLKREKYEENSTFEADLSTGDRVILPLSTTVWGVFDALNNRLGSITFERRFCTQQDFAMNKSKALLMSFNEMYFVAMPPELYGWGMDFDAFPRNLSIYVKQLRIPVNKALMSNLRKAETRSNFSYIMLGSVAT